jgi:type IV secretion system protein VirD4
MSRAGQTGPDGGRQGVDRLLIGVVLTALVVIGWVWVTGEIGGVLVSGRWPRVSPQAGLGLAVRLPGRLGHPADAWPAAVRSTLPGWPLFLAIAVVTSGLASGLVFAGRWVWRAGGGPVPTRPAGRAVPRRAPRMTVSVPRRHRVPVGATWARPRDLRSLVSPGPAPGRLVIGRRGRALVAAEARHSLLVLGPTQSGKTAGLAIPAVLEWEGPVVATSVKGDLAAATLGWRRAQGTCWVFDPTGTSGLGFTSGWSPIAEARDWSGAQRVASWMVDATPARSGMTDGAFWFAAAAKQLAPLLLAARCAGTDMAAVVRWTNTDEWDEPAALLEGAGQDEAGMALLACAARDERIRSSVGTTLETVLSPFEDPTVIASIAGVDIDPARLLRGHHTLYLCGPAYEQARLQGLLAALVSSVVAAAVDQATSTGRPLDPPLLLVLDEAANIAPIRDLDALASTGAGLGIQLVTVCQDLAQFTTRYGPERSRTIANNHRAKLTLSGVADLTTLDLISGLAGEQAVREESVTADLRDGRRTRSTSVAFRRLASADEIRRIRPGTGILIYGHLPPARITLRPWFTDRRLRARAGTPAAGTHADGRRTG